MKLRASMVACFCVLVSIASLFCNSLAADAASDIWIGGGSDNLWNNGTNWLSGVAPLTGVDSLFFGGSNTNNSNNFANATFSGISFSGGASAFTLSGNALHLGVQTTGTGITHSADIVSNSANSQTISLPLVLDPGKHVFGTAAGSLKLTGSLTSSTGASVIFNPGAGPINVAGSGLATSNGILGGWATIGGDWAALDSGNNVVPYSAYADIAAGSTFVNNPASNVRILSSGTAIAVPTGTTSINSLLFAGSTANQTVNVGAGNRIVLGQNGGVFNATGISGGSTLRALTIGANAAQGGILTAGDGVNPATINLSIAPVGSSAGGLTINSSITDNGSAPVSLVLMGGYLTDNTSPNTYTGGTYILSGRISQPNQNKAAGQDIRTLGFGPVYIFPGGEINPGAGGNTSLDNNFFIAGNGTTEGNGLGAIRMFQNNNGASTLITGNVTLMADASISSNGLTLAQIAAGRNVTVTGKITGPGGLGVGSATATSANGTGILEIGSTTSTAAANNYAGDTTINGAAGGAVSAGLYIASPTNSNIMPHGLTGNYAGGPTGNVTLNGTAATRQAFFDVNGSTQTINGLSSTSASPANNFVQSTAAGGLLILGDSNATATFAGVLQDSSGTLAITKIGNGRQTFAGTSTYSGPTNINAGALSVTGALSTAGNVNVNSSSSSAGALYGAGDGFSSGVVGNVTLQGASGANKALVNPGVTGPGSTGTLTMASMIVGAGSDLQFDATNSTVGNFDQIHVTGAITFSGASTISPSITNAGTYPLIQADGGITGPTPTIGTGDTRLTYVSAVSSNSISVTASGNVANLNWTGNGNGTSWNLHSTANWSSTAPTNSTLFFNGDNVTFGNSGSTNIAVVGSVAPGSTTFTNTTGNYVLNGGSIGGSGALTVSGAGTVTLSANNSYTGGTTLNVGRLNVNSSGALGGGGLILAGGTLGNTSGRAVTLANNPNQTWSADVAFAGPFDLNLGTGAVTQTNLAAGANRAISVAGSGTLTIGGIISDGPNAGNGINKTGAGTLALNGANTFTGPVNVSAGTLVVGNFGALGTSTTGHAIAAGATLDLAGFTALNVAGGFTTPITIAGAGVNGQGAIVSTGLVGQQNAFQTINLAANATVGGDGRGTPLGPNFTGRFDIRGGAALLNLNGFTLTKSGTNQFSLGGATVNNGNIVVNQGLFSIEGASTISDNSDGTNITINPNATLQVLGLTGTVTRPIVLNAGTVNDASANSVNSTIGSNVTLQANSTFSGPNSSTLAVTGVVGQSGGAKALTKTGASTLSLQNPANTYSGGTNLNGGIVNFAALGSLGTGPLTFNGGTLQYGSGISDDVSVLPITLNAAGGTIDSNSNTIILGHNLVGSGGLTLKGNSTITLSGTNTYAGATTIQNGSVILGSSSALPTNTALLMGNAANDSPALDLAGRNITVSALSRVGTGTPNIGSSSITTPVTLTFAGNPSLPSTFGGTIQDTAPTGGTQQTSLTVASGALTLNGTNTYTGTTRVNGGRLTLDSPGSLASTSPLSLGGGTFALTGAGQSQQLGMLSMVDTSTIDFGTGASGAILHFSAAAPTWTGKLTISNWTGTTANPLTGGGVDQFYVDNNGLTSAQKNAIKFDGFPFGAQVLASNEVVPSLPGFVRGDFNKSGALDKGDLTAMFSALTDLNAFTATSGYTRGDLVAIGDFDNSGSLNNLDISGELSLLTAAGVGSVAAVPEPASLGLASIGSLIGWTVLRRHRARRKETEMLFNGTFNVPVKSAD